MILIVVLRKEGAGKNVCVYKYTIGKKKKKKREIVHCFFSKGREQCSSQTRWSGGANQTSSNPVSGEIV